MESFNIGEFENTIAPIMEFYGCETYHISYFGGEPLLNWKIIEQSLLLFKQSKKCSSVVLISNGLLLTQERVDFLKSHNCGLSWSFDGLWSSNRPLENKQDSLPEYEKIIPLALQLTSSCKVMVSANCFDTLVDNFKYFLSIGIKNPDFSLVRDNIYKQSDIEKYRTKCKELADFIIEQNRNGVLCGVGFFTLYTLDTLAAKMFGKRDFGCFVGTNGLLYAYDGSIWPCERFRSANKLRLYDSKTKEYSWNTIKKLKALSNTSTMEKCQNCEIRDYCNVGCTFSELREAHNLKVNSEKREPVESVCELFKITYENALRVFENAGKEYQSFILNQLPR